MHKIAPSSSNDNFSKSCFLTKKCNYSFIFHPIETKFSGNICVNVTNKLMVAFLNTYPTRNVEIKNHWIFWFCPKNQFSRVLSWISKKATINFLPMDYSIKFNHLNFFLDTLFSRRYIVYKSSKFFHVFGKNRLICIPNDKTC